jgi:hypothetical protein
MCTVLLPPGGNPVAVNKYIISSYHILRYRRHSCFVSVSTTCISNLVVSQQCWSPMKMHAAWFQKPWADKSHIPTCCPNRPWTFHEFDCSMKEETSDDWRMVCTYSSFQNVFLSYMYPYTSSILSCNYPCTNKYVCGYCKDDVMNW